MYGNKIAPSEWHPNRSVIGEVLGSQSGNVILRIGREWTNDSARGWEQTEHVVLKWTELPALVSEMYAVTKIRHAETVRFAFDRELAAEVLAATAPRAGGPPYPSEKLQKLRANLTTFAESEPR